MELFRMREIKEFLSIDELKEKCDIADEHMEMLEVCDSRTIFAIQSFYSFIHSGASSRF